MEAIDGHGDAFSDMIGEVQGTNEEVNAVNAHSQGTVWWFDLI